MNHSSDPYSPWDAEAFRKIYDEYYSLICRYAYVITGDSDLARDTASELFFQLWQRRHKMDVHTNLKNYLLVSARRLAKRQLGRQRRYQPLPSLDEAQPASVTEQSSHSLLYKENAALLDDLLKKLPPLRRKIIELRLLGLTQKEIAASLDLSAKKVEYQLNIAVETLQEEVRLRPHLRPELSFLLVVLASGLIIW